MTDMVNQIEMGRTVGSEFTPLVPEPHPLTPIPQPSLTHPFQRT